MLFMYGLDFTVSTVTVLLPKCEKMSPIPPTYCANVKKCVHF